MKRVILALLCLLPLPSLALDIVPYTPQAFEAAQKAGKGIALHFKANWCPSCRAQSKVFQGWAGDASVPGTLFVADYDKEKALEKTLGVKSQAVVIFYRGTTEEDRLAFVTDPAALRQYFRSIE